MCLYVCVYVSLGVHVHICAWVCVHVCVLEYLYGGEAGEYPRQTQLEIGRQLPGNEIWRSLLASVAIRHSHGVYT